MTESCREFRKAVENILPCEPFIESFSFGLIDKKQKKIWVLSDADLADAYAATISGQPVWVDPSPTVVVDGERGSKKASKQANKRKHNLLK